MSTQESRIICMKLKMKAFILCSSFFWPWKKSLNCNSPCSEKLLHCRSKILIANGQTLPCYAIFSIKMHLILLCGNSSCTVQVAMKLAPDRKKFMEVIGGSGDINADMEKFCATFSPLLEENHKFLVRCLQVSQWFRK